MKQRILFVDDEAMLLEMYRLVFEGDKDRWDIQFAPGAKEALALMEQQPFDVVVSDMRMPGMSGADLFQEVSKLYPQTSRLIMSGYADQEQIAKCIGATHQFIAKPFDIKLLKSTIWRVCALDGWMLDEKLRTVVAQLYSVPSLPSLYFRIMDALASPDAGVDTIGAIVAKDPAMTAKILQLVNSAFFGIARKVSNATEAVQYLGVGRVRSLVLSLHVFSCFDKVKIPNFSIERVWAHSLATGMVAQMIAKQAGANRADQDETYVAGMLHDIGKVMLASSFADKYAAAVALAAEKKVPMIDAEREIFGVSHSEVGAYLLGLWGLPISIVEAVALHHTPHSSGVTTFSPLTAVHAASVFENEISTSDIGAPVPKIDQEYMDAIGLADRVEDWRDIAREAMGAVGA
jgi:putative nucleotidyltransferase with HDIG domain